MTKRNTHRISAKELITTSFCSRYIIYHNIGPNSIIPKNVSYNHFLVVDSANDSNVVYLGQHASIAT